MAAMLMRACESGGVQTTTASMSSRLTAVSQPWPASQFIFSASNCAVSKRAAVAMVNFVSLKSVRTGARRLLCRPAPMMATLIRTSFGRIACGKRLGYCVAMGGTPSMLSLSGGGDGGARECLRGRYGNSLGEVAAADSGIIKAEAHQLAGGEHVFSVDKDRGAHEGADADEIE